MRLADLSVAEVEQRLLRGGLRIRTGPVLNSITSPLAAVREGVMLHYADHPVEDATAFADFHISIERPPGPRRWFNRQIVFCFDGQKPFNPLPGDQGFPMLEWGMNWCLSGLCHQYLTLHAAVVERGGRAVLMPAASGSGKSTLCAGLLFRGWRLLSDELAVLDPATGEVLPVPRPVSLKNESIAVMRRFAPEVVFGAIVRETLKGSVGHFKPPMQAVHRAHERARPAWIVRPRYRAGAPASLQPMSKGSALMHVIECAFNFNVHGRQGFELLANLVEHCDCYEFTYGDLEDAAACFAKLADAPASGP